VSFEHRNIAGLHRSLLGSVTSSNLLNPQVSLWCYIELLSVLLLIISWLEATSSQHSLVLKMWNLVEYLLCKNRKFYSTMIS
jgi:hypothetical protein